MPVYEGGRLVGVLKMHDLLFTPRDARLHTFMVREPMKVKADTTMNALRQFFDEHKFFGVPVVDHDGRLMGVVLPEAVMKASRRKAVRQYLGFSGIVGGEEFRSMPLLVRSGRRIFAAAGKPSG